MIAVTPAFFGIKCGGPVLRRQKIEAEGSCIKCNGRKVSHSPEFIDFSELWQELGSSNE